MSILIQEIKKAEYITVTSSFTNQLPIWLMPEFVDCYKHNFILKAVKGVKTVGVWVVPFTIKGNQIVIRREYRFFPYSSPFILETDNLARREITHSFFTKLTSLCNEINLPFSPYFKDLAVIQALGGYVEWRHTHGLTKPLIYQQITSRLRNHIKSARKKIKISLSNNPDDFNFDVAIKGSEEERKLRKNLVLKLLRNEKAIILSARDPNLCGGILIAFDNNCAYMFHSWQNKIVPRGTISVLIFESIAWVFNYTKLSFFDFEGSVIQNIDYFFSGFNGEIIPYGHIFWNTKKDELFKSINKSINLRGRLI